MKLTPPNSLEGSGTTEFRITDNLEGAEVDGERAASFLEQKADLTDRLHSGNITVAENARLRKLIMGDLDHERQMADALRNPDTSDKFLLISALARLHEQAEKLRLDGKDSSGLDKLVEDLTPKQ